MAGASGRTAGAQIVGLKELGSDLRELGGEWARALRSIHKVVADEGANQAQRDARGMGGVQAHYAKAIKAYASERDARVGIRTSGDNAGASVAFWGAEKRTGWYAKGRYADSPTPQHPAWVGNSWDVAVAGEGPYAINSALARYLPYLLEDYERMIDELTKKAFPK